MSSKRVLSGMQPSGKLHLGNLVGAVNNWLSLQNNYDASFFIADWHALTTHYQKTENLDQNKTEMMIDWLATGIDPEKATLFVQSDVKEHAELHLIFSMITPLSWLERVPTYKEKMENIKGKDLHTYGFLGYPVLQAADIVLHDADIVPVGIDQLPHLELAREIVRSFHHIYGTTVFKEPQQLMTEVPKLTGMDGRKMSKSYENAIYISDSEEDIKKKVMSYITDPARIRKTDAGNPDVCNLFPLHKLFSTDDTCKEVVSGCKSASLGCVECKKKATAAVTEALFPIQERRRHYEGKEADVKEIFHDGADRARVVAQEMIEKVNRAIKI